MDPVTIRHARSHDLAELSLVYDHYVATSDATLDIAPTIPSERQSWFDAYAENSRHQLLVAEHDGSLDGYVTSSRYRSHPAFDHTVEVSVYLRPDARGRGTGGALYDALLHRLASLDVHCVVAGVALPNPASVALHLSRGFREVGTFTEYAAKNGRWISSTWFEQLL